MAIEVVLASDTDNENWALAAVLGDLKPNTEGTSIDVSRGLRLDLTTPVIASSLPMALTFKTRL